MVAHAVVDIRVGNIIPLDASRPEVVQARTALYMFADLELRVLFRSQGTRWPLRTSDAVEVWSGMTLLGTISGGAIRMLIEHHLSAAQLQAHLAEELAANRDPDDDTPALEAPRTRLAPAVSWKKQEELRTARRSRRRRKP